MATTMAVAEKAPQRREDFPILMTIRQAESTGVACARKVRMMCASGEIRAVKVGTDWRINRDAFFEHFGLE